MTFTTGTNFTIVSGFTTGTDLIIGASPPVDGNNTSSITSGSVKLVGSVLQVEAQGPEVVELGSGQIILKGSLLHSVASNLLGSIAYDPSAEGTDDWYYLSDDLNTYEGTNWPPSCSAIGLDQVGATLTSNLPVEAVTYAISTGHIPKTYLDDYYYRVHLSIYSLGLGNVLSEQVYNLEIWNAWFVDNTLSTVTETDVADILLNLAETLPHTFTPLEFITGTINVAALGTPTIDGSFSFNFTTESALLEITGRRVIIWPFLPLADFTETRQWLTDILPSKNKEQRFNLREVPRLTLSYNYLFKGSQDYSQARTMAKALAGVPLAVPLWSDVVKVSNISVGASTIYFTTSYLELYVGSVIVLWTSHNSYELAEVAELYSDRVVIARPLLQSHVSCWLAPVVIGYAAEGLNFSEAPNHLRKGSLQIKSTESVGSAVWSAPTYKGLPILTTPSLVTGGLQSRFAREVTTFDSETGLLSQFDVESYTRERQTVSILAKDREELYNLRRQLDYLKGKYTTFWLPSFQNDLIAQTDLNSGATSLKVLYSKLSEYPATHIRVVGESVTENFEITDVADNGDGTESITITPPASATITNIKYISLLTKVRLDSDTLELAHSGKRLTTVKTTTIEVSDA